MPEKANINPVVLKWARESAKLTIEVVAGKMGCDEKKIAAWENGQDLPTLKQAEKLCTLYRRPLAVFYLPEPPVDFETLRDFRRKDHRKEYSTALTFMMREIQSRQAWLKEMLAETGEPSLPFIGRFTTHDAITEVARDIREILEVEDRPETNNILKYWIERVESKGIFVSLSSFIHSRMTLDVDEVRGFAISDKLAPFVFINSADYPNSQLFTLIHELAHLWIGQTGVFDMPSIEFRSPSDANQYDPIEIFCNAVAAEVLMPSKRLQDIGAIRNVEDIEQLARRFCVSSLAMCFRLLNIGLITRPVFTMTKDELDQKFKSYMISLKGKESKGSPNPYVLQIRKNSKSFSHLVFDFFKGGRISGLEASTLLHVKINNFPKFETYLMR